MNNGQFSSADKPIEQRVTHIEQVLPTLARLSEQQRILDSYENTHRSVQAIEIQLHKLTDEYKIFFTQSTEQKSEMKESFSKLECMQGDCHEKIRSLTQKQDNGFTLYASEIERVKSTMVEMKLDLEKSKDEFKNHPKVLKMEEILAVSNTCLDRHKADIQDLKSEIIKLKDVIAKAEQSILEIKSSKSDLEHVVESLQNNIQRLTNMCASSFRDHEAEIRQVKISMLQSIDAKIASIPQPEKIDIDDVRKLVAHDIELYSLDARNANLKSGINESKIVVLEKKVEQLFLLLSKFELSK